MENNKDKVLDEWAMRLNNDISRIFSEFEHTLNTDIDFNVNKINNEIKDIKKNCDLELKQIMKDYESKNKTDKK